MTEKLNFQSIIMRLQQYWSDYGCLIWQPYYTQVGAGTMNPATFLRVLGPEPWNVAYVEPSVRPDDGRYGENPNRMQMHYQFQVILKPDPGNPQEIYLESLQALGINPRCHDIRFVEDNWESPALGAWGLGWEVWLDGQEIAQFTYFQQAGGLSLEPVSVEITYGLERIAIPLQQVDSFRDIQWSPTFTDGDVNLQAEREHSTYYFENADIDRLRHMYDLFEAEANACLDAGLVLPAHDYVLKCSHTFNVLDTRGVIGVTERQAFFGRMRKLSHQIAQAYLEQRRSLGFPWMKKTAPRTMATSELEPPLWGNESPSSPAPFLLEIGTEELPNADLSRALAQLEKLIPQQLEELHLSYGRVQVSGTPRRLVVLIEDLAPRQPDLEQMIKGPPAARSFNPDGSPSPAALGFARSKDIAVEALQKRQIDGGEYVVAIIHQPGLLTPKVLQDTLPEILAKLNFTKSMRWNDTQATFSRPIRWLLALFGHEDDCRVLPFEFAGLASTNLTRGLRFYNPVVKQVSSPSEYFDFLNEQGIILDFASRMTSIKEQAQALASQVDGTVEDDPNLLEEVTNLVEAPQALLGSFDPEFLELPDQVLISVMKKHQRYFPLFKMDDPHNASARTLLPHFIVIRNGDNEGMDLVRRGNEHVVRARFTDAAFFVREDEKQPLAAYLPRLDTLTFQANLGSMLDKTQRLIQLVERLSPMLGLNQTEQQTARRAAELCKADLATKMVVEMTSLQGWMGRLYALRSGETEAVALAIFEHYLPRFSGDQIPRTRPGLALGLVDRLDSLLGLFAVDLAPSGNKDPYGLRRAALSLVQNLVEWKQALDLRLVLQSVAEILPIEITEEHERSVLEFIVERQRNLLRDLGFRYDVVNAVLAAQGHNPHNALESVQALQRWVERPDWESILPAYARCARITRDTKQGFEVNPSLFAESAEHELFSILSQVENAIQGRHEVDAFLEAFLPMIPTINSFFDKVLVMVDDEEIRQNRLGLLQRIVALGEGIADFSRLEGF